jgi:hypothetical protein
MALDALTISREKFDRFNEFYRPIEDEYMAGLFDPQRREQQVGEAVDVTRSAFDQQARAQNQTMARYGRPQGDISDFMQRRRRIEQALAETSNANRARGLSDDRDLMGAQQISAMSRGLSGQVSSAANQAGQMQSARNNAYDQAKAQYNSDLMGMGGTMLGLGSAALMMSI